MFEKIKLYHCAKCETNLVSCGPLIFFGSKKRGKNKKKIR